MTDVAHRSRRLLWTVIFAILLLGFASFYYFKQHNTSQYNQLKSVQLEFKQALDNTDSIQTEHLQDLTQKIVVIKSSVDKDIPQDLQKQYDEIITKLSQLTSSSDSALSSVAQDLLSQLTNQAGEGIGLEGKNNTVIVNKGVTDINGKTGSVTVQGTSNQTNVSTNGNTVTVGTAQDISQNSSPTFNNQTLNGDQNVVGNSAIQGSGSVSGNVFVGGNTSTNTLTIQSGGTQNGYALCDASNNCGYSGAGSSYVQGGNSFGNPAVIGTNDNNSLNLRTKGINRITIDTSGNSSFSGNINTLGSLSAGSLSGNGSGLTNVDAGALNGNVAGNNSGQIALNNSTLNSNLNADLLDGQHGSYYQNASNLDSGTVADARLSSNVALQNTSNIFSLQQTFSSGFQGTTGSLSGSLTVNGAATLQGLTTTGILQNGYQVCDSSNNCNYAPSSGGAGYIQNQTATSQAAGFNISGNGTIGGALLVQGGISSPGIGSQSEVFGYGASAAGNRSLAIGNGATATVVSNGASGAIAIGYGAIAHQHANSGSVAIGYLASSTDVGSVALGQNAAANSQSSIAIGMSSTGATSGVAIGANATVGGLGSIAIGSSASSVQSGQGGGIAIGLSSNVTNAYSIAIGRASVSAYSNSIVLGHSAVSTAANQLVIGGATTISQGYIGNGATAASPQSFTLNATGGSGTDIQGANIAIAGGRGTGSATGGNILFQTSAVGTSGTTLNALSERMRITSNGDIGINNTNPQSVIDVGARSSTDSAYMSLRSGSTSSVRSAVRFYQGTTEYGNVGFVSSTNLTLQGLNRNITVATSTNNSSIELATCSACASSSDSTRHRLLVTTSGLSYQDGNNVAYMTLNRTSGTFAQAISIGATSNMGQLGILNNNASQVGLAIQAAPGQTANIQEWRDSNGANLLAVDSGGVLWGRDLTSGFRGSLDLQSSNNALILRNTNTQAFRIGFIGPNDAELSYGGRVNVNGLYTFSGNYVSFSNNIRGYNVAVSASSTEKTVTFATAHANANYAVFCTPNWNTSCYVTDKTTTGFKLNYGTPAPSGQLVDWFVAR